MPAALRATGYVIQIVDPFDLERDMPAALDKGEVAARIGDLRQIDQLAPFNPFELSHGLSPICGSVVVSIVYHFEVVCQSHMRISPSRVRRTLSWLPFSRILKEHPCSFGNRIFITPQIDGLQVRTQEIRRQRRKIRFRALSPRDRADRASECTS